MDPRGRQELSKRTNGLNLLRLLLAGCVLLAHALLVAGVPAIPHTDLGYWGVAGFFCISGYLVSRSAHRLRTAEYLRHRAGRLFPAYWACLLVTGLLIAPLAAGELSLLDDGLRYALINAGLIVFEGSIGQTPAVGHYPAEWNASLWTLPHEFACYIVICPLMLVAIFRGSRAWIGWFSVWALATLVHIVLLRLAPDAPFAVRGFIRLLPLFLGGALIQSLWSLDRLVLRTGVLALASGATVTAIQPAYGLQVAAPLLAYGLLAVGTRLPCPRWVRRHDLSYGSYLYAFPVTQLGAYYWLPDGEIATALWIFSIAVTTLGLAAISWFWVERKALLWARREGPGSRAAPRLASAPQ